MARQIQNATAAAAPAARANSVGTYPNATNVNWPAAQDKARPNLLDRDAELDRSTGGCDRNKTHDCP